MHCLRHWNWINQCSARAISDYTTVWCLATPCTMVCSGFTATRSLRNYSTAATNWTLLWFGLQVLTMVLSWSHEIQFGTHGFCSFSLPQHKPTLGPNRLSVLSCQRWKHITILRMVIIDIIVIIVIIVKISVLLRLLRLLSLWRLLWLFRLLTLLNLFRLVRINWFVSCIRAHPHKSDSVLNTDSEYPGKMPFVPVGDTGTIPHHLRHHFPGAPGDSRPGFGDGCRMWFVNSWALG